MKRNSLTTAVLAGLTGVAGMAGVANAVNVNPDGLGQVLLYPYYTARGENDTMFSVVNTTDSVKAVKVRFMEALNSREVLDFNLYLSPYDVWTAGVTELADGVPGMRTFDTSCTVPDFIRQYGGEHEFLNFQYAGSNADGGPTGIERAASGYIEIIEMGNVADPSLAAMATHGPTFNCAGLNAQWVGGGAWVGGAGATGMSEPTGGLFGAGAVINVDEGTMVSYNATAVDGFWAAGVIEHTDPGSLEPNLGGGDVTSYVFNNGVLDTQTWAEGIQAFDAVLSLDKVFNEFQVDASIGAASEWVLTFPTKRFHTDIAPGSPALASSSAPFTDLWEVHRGGTPSCEAISFRFWDREEGEPLPGGVVPSPRPPGPPGFLLCREANVVRFAHSGAPDSTEIFKEVQRPGALGYVNFDLPADFNEGWARFDLGTRSAGDRLSEPANFTGDQYRGLPVVGFWANTVQNGALASGVLSNYGAAYQHRGSRHIVRS